VFAIFHGQNLALLFVLFVGIGFVLLLYAIAYRIIELVKARKRARAARN
jgi:hypothetical protein